MSIFTTLILLILTMDNKIIEETEDYISNIFKEVDKILISNNQSNKNIIELVNFVRRRKV